MRQIRRLEKQTLALSQQRQWRLTRSLLTRKDPLNLSHLQHSASDNAKITQARSAATAAASSLRRVHCNEQCKTRPERGCPSRHALNGGECHRLSSSSEPRRCSRRVKHNDLFIQPGYRISYPADTILYRPLPIDTNAPPAVESLQAPCSASWGQTYLACYPTRRRCRRRWTAAPVRASARLCALLCTPAHFCTLFCASTALFGSARVFRSC